MWHLAIESSGIAGSVAVGKSSTSHPFEPVASQRLPDAVGSVKSLAPAIQDVLRAADLTASNLDLISVTVGPGSFTGLRVGLATAKMLSMALGIPVVGVDTLEAIAQRYVDSAPTSASARLVTVLNAFRKQVFAAAWYVDQGQVLRASESKVLDASDWLNHPWDSIVDEGETDAVPSIPVTLTGEGLKTVSVSSGEYEIADAALWVPLAEQVGYLGWRNFARGEASDADSLQPNYIRASAAEEKRR